MSIHRTRTNKWGDFITRAAAIAVLCLVSRVSAHSGSTVWGGWRFDWEVKDDAGLAIRNVFFNNHEILYKASMPVIRVQYDCCCGPYADRINWGKLVGISNCGNRKVCQKSYTVGARNWLELGVYARIGSYHLYQAWYFSQDGWIRGRLWSKGLQCEVDHNHHPYWRMDFDMDGPSADQVFVYDTNRPDEGWGSGWHLISNETNGVKNPPTSRAWFVRDGNSTNGTWVVTGDDDGVSDVFSNKDYAARRYHWWEDEPWPFGANGHLGYNDSENIDGRDVVFWYVAHLHHRSEGGGDEWHSVGPTLFVLQPSPIR